MRPLIDYLRVRVPAVIAYESDPRWAARGLAAALEGLGGEAGTVVTWALDRGFFSTSASIAQSGLARATTQHLQQVDPAMHLLQLLGWLESQTSERSVIGGGTVVLHDLAPFLDRPLVTRLLGSVAERCAALRVRLLLLVPARLPATHPLAAVFAQVPVGGSPVARHGPLVQSLLAEVGLAVGDLALEHRLAAHLDGVATGPAEAVVRLAAGLLLAEPQPVHAHRVEAVLQQLAVAERAAAGERAALG